MLSHLKNSIANLTLIFAAIHVCFGHLLMLNLQMDDIGFTF